MEIGQNPQHKVFVSVVVDMGAGLILLKDYKDEGSSIPSSQLKTGQSLEECALLLVKEQTGLNVELTRQFHTYSHHTKDFINVVFKARGWGNVSSKDVGSFHEMNLPSSLTETGKEILNDYFHERY